MFLQSFIIHTPQLASEQPVALPVPPHFPGSCDSWLSALTIPASHGVSQSAGAITGWSIPSLDPMGLKDRIPVPMKGCEVHPSVHPSGTYHHLVCISE